MRLVVSIWTAMKSVLVAALVALVTAVPEHVPVGGISRVFSKDDGQGNYQFAYNERVGSSGTFRSESGDKSGAKVGSYGIKDDKGNTRVVSYVADENGFRAQIKATDGSDTASPDSSGTPQAVSVTNAKVVEVAPVKYHVKHAPVFHYYAGGATREDSPTRVRVTLRKHDKGQRKPIESIAPGQPSDSAAPIKPSEQAPPAAIYYSEDVSFEEGVDEGQQQRTKGSHIKEEGIVRKIPSMSAPHYSEPLAQAVPSGPSLYSAGQPQPIAYSSGWPTPDEIRKLGRHISPVQYVPSQQQQQQGGGTAQHYALGRHYAIGLPEDTRKVDVEYNPNGQQQQQQQQAPQYSWGAHPFIKRFELPPLPLLHPHIHYVSSNWQNTGSSDTSNVGQGETVKKDETNQNRNVGVYKILPALPLPVHYIQDVRKVDSRPVYTYGLHHHLDSLRNGSLKIGETLGKRFGHYSGGWPSSDSSQNYHPLALHNMFKVPVVYSSSWPATSWTQSEVNPSWAGAKKIAKLGAYSTGWSNSNSNQNQNQGTVSGVDNGPSGSPSNTPDRSWSSVPAWW